MKTTKRRKILRGGRMDTRSSAKVHGVVERLIDPVKEKQQSEQSEQTTKETPPEPTKEEVLASIYYDPKTGYGSARTLYEKVKGQGITMKQVKSFLAKQETQQINRKKQRVKKYLPITAGGDGSFQADLTFYNQFKKQNKIGKKQAIGILTCINIHSRKAYAKPIFGKKTGEDSFDTEGSVLNAIKDITEDIKKRGKFVNLTTDNGSEFISKTFRAYMEKEGVTQHFADAGDWGKNSMGKVERFNRTIRGLIQKHMTAKNTTKWVDVLPDLLDNYNNTFHSSIKSTPNKADVEEVIEEENETAREVVAEEMELKEGDKVRLLKPRETFQKGGQQYYKGIYTIHKRNHQSYTLLNPAGDVLGHRVKFYDVERVGEVQTDTEKKKGKDAVVAAKKDTQIDAKIARAGIERAKDTAAPRPKRNVKKKTFGEDFVEESVNITGKRVRKKNPRYS